MKQLITEITEHFNISAFNNKNLDELIKYLKNVRGDNDKIILRIDIQPDYNGEDIIDKSQFQYTREETDKEYEERIKEEKAAEYRNEHFQQKKDMKEYERIKQKYNIK